MPRSAVRPDGPDDAPGKALERLLDGGVAPVPLSYAQAGSILLLWATVTAALFVVVWIARTRPEVLGLS